jgi:hypothetical protein
MSSVKFNEEEWNRKVKIATAGLANIKIPKLTAKELVVLSKVFPSEKKEEKKPIPFIIESDSEEEEPLNKYQLFWNKICEDCGKKNKYCTCPAECDQCGKTDRYCTCPAICCECGEIHSGFSECGEECEE